MKWVGIILLILSFISIELSSQNHYVFYPAGYDRPKLEIDDSFSMEDVDTYIYFVESEYDLPSEEIFHTHRYTKPHRTSEKAPNFGYSENTYYGYFRIADSRKIRDELYLTLDYPILDDLSLICFNEAGEKSLEQQTGDHIPYSKWPVKFRKPGFFLDTEIKECIFKGKSTSSLQFHFELYSLNAYHDARVDDTMAQSLYFGAILAIIVYNLLVSVPVRQRIYFFYTMFLLSYSLFQLTISGLGYIFFFHYFPNFIVDNVLLFSIFLMNISSLLFFIYLLEIKKFNMNLYKFSIYNVYISTVVVPLYFIIPYSIGIRISTVLLSITFVSILGVSVYLSLKKNTLAILYLSAWLLFILGGISFILMTRGVIERNFFTNHGPQISSVILFLVFSFAMGYQWNLLEKKIASELRHVVQEKTNLLWEEYERSQKLNELMEQVEKEKENAKSAYFQLESSQQKLVQSDKMITLGTMVAGIAHEINTPLGAIKANGENIKFGIQDLKKFLDPKEYPLSPEDYQILSNFLNELPDSTPPLSTREARVIRKKLISQLESLNLSHSEASVDILLELGLGERTEFIESYFKKENFPLLLNLAFIIQGIRKKALIIEDSANRVSKIVKSLKSFMHFEQREEMSLSNLIDGMETVLTILNNKIKQGIEVNTNYEDLPQIYCFPDELNQIWTNLIHNAIQAMGENGILQISISLTGEIENPDIDKRDLNYKGKYVAVSVEDNGPGIPPAIRKKIFEAFFTTKPVGEGSGLGLHIIGKILEKHSGVLELVSNPGKTKFTVKIPARTTIEDENPNV